MPTAIERQEFLCTQIVRKWKRGDWHETMNYIHGAADLALSTGDYALSMDLVCLGLIAADRIVIPEIAGLQEAV